MKKAILGKKLGMTQLFDEAGKLIPVTVVEAGPCVVVQKKTVDNDGYEAVQIGYKDIEDRKVTKPLKGHFDKAGVGYKRFLREFKLEDAASMNIGDEITVENYWDTLIYKVIDKQIHKKDESADCYITEGRDLLTLITCVSNGRGGFDRFYLICERKST